jgi:hypothetical protein
VVGDAAGVAAAAAGFVSVVVLLDELDVPSPDELLELESEALEPDFADEYRSEYQPPPLRIKFVPPLIRRWAVDFAQVGHTWVGGSTIRCTSSH